MSIRRLGQVSMVYAVMLLSIACGSEPARLPSHVAFEEPSPTGEVVAVIYLEKRRDLLGGYDRAWLALRYADSECLLTYELTEGTGTYEGGVSSLTWLNDVEVLVRRYVSDQRRDIVYNTATRSWRPHTED